MRLIGGDTVSKMNATSTIDGRNEIKITILSIAKQRSMTADDVQPSHVERQRKAIIDDGNHRRAKTVFGKIQFHQNNIVFLLVPILLMILKETSALPPIIKIGEWQIFSPFHFTLVVISDWINNLYICFVQTGYTRSHNTPLHTITYTLVCASIYALMVGCDVCS